MTARIAPSRRSGEAMKAVILTSGGLIAARILSSWLGAGHSVAALWTGTKDPDQVLGGDRTLGLVAHAWSIAALVRRHSIPVLSNPKLSSPEAEAEIARLGSDMLITAMTHQIVPERILARFPGRAVNIHPALLPHYRGPSPRIGMLLDGTAGMCGGVTLHCLARGIDEGDIIGLRAVPYDVAHGFIDWDVRLAAAAGELVQNELQAYLRGDLRPHAQHPALGATAESARTSKRCQGRIRPRARNCFATGSPVPIGSASAPGVEENTRSRASSARSVRARKKSRASADTGSNSTQRTRAWPSGGATP